MVSSLPTQAEQPKRRSNDPISWYLQNIGRVPLLTPAEEIELGNQVQKMMILTEDGQLNEKINEFTTDEIISNSKDIINDYFSKSIESIFELKNHSLFPVLENINNYLINRTN